MNLNNESGNIAKSGAKVGIIIHNSNIGFTIENDVVSNSELNKSLYLNIQ
jgi:hypothetical protein